MVLAFFHYRPGPVGCLFTMGAKDHLSDFALRGWGTLCPEETWKSRSGWKTWWPLKIGLISKGKANVFQLHPFFRWKNDVRLLYVCLAPLDVLYLSASTLQNKGSFESKQWSFQVLGIYIYKPQFFLQYLSKCRQMIETKENGSSSQQRVAVFFQSILVSQSVGFRPVGCGPVFYETKRYMGPISHPFFLFSRKELFQIDVVTNGTPWFFS